MGTRKKVVLFVGMMLGLATMAPAQEETGLMYPSRFGLSYQKKALGIDVGLISFNQWSDESTFTFYDITLGVESYVTKPFVMAPKLSLDVGIGDILTLGGGIDLSMPTDFSRSEWILTPKVGISLASIVRIYYGHHIFKEEQLFPHYGKHRISLEVNLAAFHEFELGL